MASNRKLKKRAARLEDLEAIEELSRGVDFDVGYHNIKVYFETSSDGWNVFEDEAGEVSGLCVAFGRF